MSNMILKFALQGLLLKMTWQQSEIIVQNINGMVEQERESISGILTTTKAHAKTLEVLCEDHTAKSSSIEQKALVTFQDCYMDYEPTGTTPIRSEPDAPSKASIESLRAMPMESLLEEFRENQSYDTFAEKDTKISLIPRLPLSQINE